jgi:hypothetical protein
MPGKARGAHQINRMERTAMAVVKKDDAGPEVISLARIERKIVLVPIEGVSPLIPHNWSEKARRLMRFAQGIAVDGMDPAVRAAREAKDPQAEAEASLYRLDDGRPGMPCTAFKAAIADAARDFAKISIVQIKQSVFVHGDGVDQLVAVEGEMTMREDMPRNANGNADLRYRYAIWPWRANLVVEFKANFLNEASVIALVDAAGDGGIGDWRPSAPKSKTGTFGRFHVQ